MWVIFRQNCVNFTLFYYTPTDVCALRAPSFKVPVVTDSIVWKEISGISFVFVT